MTIAKTFEEFVRLFTDDFGLEYEQKGKFFFLKNPDADILLKNVSDVPVMRGLPLGKQEKFFEPSLFLLELLSKRTKNKIFINDQAEWLFLCGRDVFLSSISRNESRNNVFLVQNSRDENLGLGVKTKMKGKSIVKNLTDRGDFLRREN